MNKVEFLDILRQSLSGEVTNQSIEQNVRYYDGYISAQTPEEEADIIDRLGDPRLIAKTIIEAEKAAKEKSMNNWSGSNYQSHTTEAEEEHRDNSDGQGKNVFFTNMQWYHKLIAILVVIVLFVLIALIGRLVIGFLFAFGIPILLVLLVMSLFRKR
jgi:uncharacterized membrane protein